MALQFTLTGAFSNDREPPEPLDLDMHARISPSALRSGIAVTGLIRASALAREAQGAGTLDKRGLVVQFTSDRGDALVLRVSPRLSRHAPLFAASVLEGGIERDGKLLFSVALRFDFRHDLPAFFKALRIERA